MLVNENRAQPALQAGAAPDGPSVRWNSAFLHQRARLPLFFSRPNTHLMVIGYGFGDEHINQTIIDAQEHGLETFIVDPGGPRC